MCLRYLNATYEGKHLLEFKKQLSLCDGDEKLRRCFRLYKNSVNRQNLAFVITSILQDTYIKDWSFDIKPIPEILKEMFDQPNLIELGCQASAAGGSAMAAISSGFDSVLRAHRGIGMLVCQEGVSMRMV
jgi:hypothetical protein